MSLQYAIGNRYHKVTIRGIAKSLMNDFSVIIYNTIKCIHFQVLHIQL